jgi:hypothetical protein
MGKQGAAGGQGTFLVEQLKEGWIYRDALSGCLVLVMEKEVAEYHVGRTPGKVMVKRMVGWYWNPVWGKHAEMELNDNQLMSVRGTL